MVVRLSDYPTGVCYTSAKFGVPGAFDGIICLPAPKGSTTSATIGQSDPGGGRKYNRMLPHLVVGISQAYPVFLVPVGRVHYDAPVGQCLFTSGMATCGVIGDSKGDYGQAIDGLPGGQGERK